MYYPDYFPGDWQIENTLKLNLIPEKDWYWIIDGKNWLHEIYGKAFSKLYFGV